MPTEMMIFITEGREKIDQQQAFDKKEQFLILKVPKISLLKHFPKA
jgi:hypothetical protein